MARSGMITRWRWSVVLDSAAHRLRPKLLTEATTLLGLAPLLLASGPGSEILEPMVVPVLGGLLIADEVIDRFLPLFFCRERLHRLRFCKRSNALPGSVDDKILELSTD